MADTWGDIIGRNYSAGRAIANDFVSARYSKKADQLRTTYEERAKAEGKQNGIEDYLPEMEKELRQIAAGVGATRRNVTDNRGRALDIVSRDRIREDVGTEGERRAGELAIAGDQAGGRQSRAITQYKLGNYDDGQQQQIAGDTITATKGALGADGVYDQKAGAKALATVGANYGDANAANAQTENADTFRMKSAAAKATQLYNLISNPESATPDQIRGLWAGIKQDVPEFQNVDLQLENGKIYIYENGKNTGDLDPQEAAQLLQTAIQRPGEAIQSSISAQLKNIEDQKTMRNDVDKKVLESSLKVIENLKAANIPDTVATAVLAAQKAVSSTGGGWQLQDIGDQPGTFLMQKGGDVYTIKVNAPDPISGEPKQGLQVFAADGVTPVPADVLNKNDAVAMQTSLADLAMAKANAGTQMNLEVLRQQLGILNEVRSAYGGTPSARGSISSALPADAKAVQADYEDLGQQFGFTTTSALRSAEENEEVGGVANSQHLDTRGTARDWSVKDKSPEEIKAFVAALEAKGYEVITRNHGTGPHIHAELPPGARVAVAKKAPGAATIADLEAQQKAKGGATTAAAKPAASAAKPQSAISRTAKISPDVVRDQGKRLATVNEDATKARDALTAFDRDQRTTLGEDVPMSAIRFGATPGRAAPTNLSPAQLKVREALVSQVERLESERDALESETSANAKALRRQIAGDDIDREAAELAKKYGGAADFFSRAGGAP